MPKKRVDHNANAFELFLSSSRRSNSAICIQMTANFFRLLLFTELSKEVLYSKMLRQYRPKKLGSSPLPCLTESATSRHSAIVDRRLAR